MKAKVFYLTLLIVMLPLTGGTQQGQIPDEVLRELAKDLADLNREVLQAQRLQEAASRAVGYRLAVTVTSESAPVRLGADKKAKVSFSAKWGQTFDVVDKVGDWYAVRGNVLQGEGEQHMAGFAADIRTGWINASNVVPTIKAGGVAAEKGKGFEKSLEGVKTAPGTHQEEDAGVFLYLAEGAAKVRDRYRQNPYFFVKGFSVALGLPPSLELTFEFK